MEEKRESLDRVITFLRKVRQTERGRKVGKTVSSDEFLRRAEKFHADFKKEMDDDFNAPSAVAVLFEIVNAGNKVFDDADSSGKNLSGLTRARQVIEEAGDILGISFEETPLSVSRREIEEVIRLREDLRRRKMFKEADRLRKELEKKGIILEDTREGTQWYGK
jgi:cysteinyl-tRNA synthetase